MSLENGSFEVAGDKAYEADGWTTTVTTSSVEGAFAFGEFDVLDDAQGTDTVDSFDWSEWKAAFAGFYADLAYAFFDSASGLPRDREDFDDLWGAGPARLESSTGPWMLAHGQTLTVVVNEGAPQNIGFLSSQFHNIADARPEEVVRAINAAAVGFSAQLYGAKVRLVTTGTGPTATLQVTGGTANAALGFSTTAANGSPDGSPWFHALEYSFAAFGGPTNRYDAFEGTGWPELDMAVDPNDTAGRWDGALITDSLESGWATLSLAPDPGDATGRYTLESAEGFESGWS